MRGFSFPGLRRAGRQAGMLKQAGGQAGEPLCRQPAIVQSGLRGAKPRLNNPSRACMVALYQACPLPVCHISSHHCDLSVSLVCSVCVRGCCVSGGVCLDSGAVVMAKDEWMDGCLDGWTSGRDGWMDGSVCCVHDPMMGKCWEDPRGLTSNGGCVGRVKVQVPYILPNYILTWWFIVSLLID